MIGIIIIIIIIIIITSTIIIIIIIISSSISITNLLVLRKRRQTSWRSPSPRGAPGGEAQRTVTTRLKATKGRGLGLAAAAAAAGSSRLSSSSSSSSGASPSWPWASPESAARALGSAKLEMPMRPSREAMKERRSWAVTFIPMPMPKTVCRTTLYNKMIQLEVCTTFSGRGMGMNITAQLPALRHRPRGEEAPVLEGLESLYMGG